MTQAPRIPDGNVVVHKNWGGYTISVNPAGRFYAYPSDGDDEQALRNPWNDSFEKLTDAIDRANAAQVTKAEAPKPKVKAFFRAYFNSMPEPVVFGGLHLGNGNALIGRGGKNPKQEKHADVILHPAMSGGIIAQMKAAEATLEALQKKVSTYEVAWHLSYSSTQQDRAIVQQRVAEALNAPHTGGRVSINAKPRG